MASSIVAKYPCIALTFMPLLVVPVSMQKSAPPRRAAIPSTSICELFAAPEKYAGKQVTVQAELRTDGIERTLLMDERCPGAAILPYTVAGAPGGDSLDASIDAVRGQFKLDTKIVGSFTGRFHFSLKPDMCMIRNKEVCRQSLEITSIKNLTVTMHQKP